MGDLFSRGVPSLELEQPLHQGHTEGSSLARAGPASGQQVLAFEHLANKRYSGDPGDGRTHQGDGALLDQSRLHPAQLGDGLQDPVIQPHLVKREHLDLFLIILIHPLEIIQMNL